MDIRVLVCSAGDKPWFCVVAALDLYNFMDEHALLENLEYYSEIEYNAYALSHRKWTVPQGR